MEQTLRITLALLLSLLCLSMRSEIAAPENVTAIELLIDAHKKMKKAEDLAILELKAIQEEQSLTQKITAKYNVTRSVLNKRLSDANSYLMLALQLTNVANKCKTLVENYTDFTTTTYQYALKKPFVMAYYTRANYELKREVKRISEMIAGYTVSGVGLMKATMKEKYQMLSMIDTQISRMNRIISHNAVICRGMIHFGLKQYHLKEFFGSQTYKDMTNEIIALWIEKSKQS